MEGLLKKIAKKKTQSYPHYSSRTVGGKSLFEWARTGKIEEIKIPEKNIKIFSINHHDTRLATREEILEEVKRKINLVKGDFRQREILNSWDKTFGKTEETFIISSFVADVSSGTYIRGLAHEMGKILNTCAIAWSIKRTRVGEYKS